jgi:DNA-binding transcriptional ArsR family regulator
MASADLLLHPVRLRIVRAFLADRTLTVAQLAAELGDVSPASLYRHVALLTKAGVLQVAAERRVRSVVERTYMLRVHAAQIQPGEASAMTAEQHLAAFTAYAAGMLADAERYLMTGTPNPLRDGASYRMAAMWLSDAEVADLVRDLAAVVQARLANPPAKGRRRRIAYSVLLPAPEATPGSAAGAKRTSGAAKTAHNPPAARPGRCNSRSP